MSRYHKGMSSGRWAALRQFIFKRDGRRCRACGRPAILECDHIQPIDRGGKKWDPDNLQALCKRCHKEKTRIERGILPDPPGVLAWKSLVTDIST